MYYYDDTMYKIPAQLVQNFGNTHIRCALRTKTTVVQAGSVVASACVAVLIGARTGGRRGALEFERSLILIYILELFFFGAPTVGAPIGGRAGGRTECAGGEWMIILMVAAQRRTG